MQDFPEKSDHNPEKHDIRIDRLSSLMARFPMRVGDASIGSGALFVLTCVGGAPSCAVFRADGAACAGAAFSMPVEWGGDANPMLRALPPEIRLGADADPDAAMLMTMLISEARAQRCGVEGALARLCEVLMIRMLRAEIARGGATDPGLLGGLTHPRISRAIVAMHDAPGRRWRNKDLAAIAGLSLSRFAELFAATLGVTPMAYLRQWRLTLARREIETGGRVKAIARDLGYASPEALSRAFHAEFGVPPSYLRVA